MKFVKIFLLVFFILPSFISAATFNVSNVTQFQNALNIAQANGQDDIINVAAGIYDLSSTTLTYNPSENKSLVIQGVGAGSIILDGGNLNQIMLIATSGLPDDSSAHITIRNLTFRNGMEDDDSGGALQVSTDTANITLEYSKFSGNSAKYNGGGADLSTTYGTATISKNTFVNNSNAGGGPSYVVYSGGGLFAGSTYGVVHLRNNIFINNSAVDQGGGARAYTYSGTINVSNNIFRGNHSTSSTSVRGAGAYFNTYTGLLNIVNNTFAYNSAVHGGGFYITLDENIATANIYNNLIFANTALSSSDSMYIMDDMEWDYTGSTVNLYNNNYNEFYIEDGDHLSQGNNINSDPLFTPSFHLQAGSPCIDAGTSSAPIHPATDFEGDPRSIDGDYDGIATWDIGADENDGSKPIPVFDGDDFTGNGYSDISVWRLSNGRWYIKGRPAVDWGKLEDIPVNGNYDGDVNKKTDIAVWRPSNGRWYLKGIGGSYWGVAGDIPVPRDYNGDGTTDIAVWRPTNGRWYLKGIGGYFWGVADDIPVPGDYNGDGVTDMAVWRPSNGRWYIKGMGSVTWGKNGDIPIPGDYNGDGIIDMAVWRPTNGRWYLKGIGGYFWGVAGDIPVPGDYNGDGVTDIAVWRPSNGRWYIKGLGGYFWGVAGDMPLVR